jgi:predicted anti-sigma-YlaC factor YlaD
MKCKRVYRYICENLDADINSPKCRAIKKHLDACPDCSAYLDSLKKTILLYKNEPGPRVSALQHRRLVKAISVAILGTGTSLRGRRARISPGKR